MVGAAANVGALATFDHRHQRLDLGTLAVGVVIETDLHLSPPGPGREIPRIRQFRLGRQKQELPRPNLLGPFGVKIVG